jgi:single-stranded DNA-binding protein
VADGMRPGWHRDRPHHVDDQLKYVTRIGVAAFTPYLRHAKKSGRDWCRFSMYERGINAEHGSTYVRRWTVYAFSELAINACACILKGDRVVVHGTIRKSDPYVNKDGELVTDDEIEAFDIGQSLLRNPAYSERNEPTGRHRNQRRIEEGYEPIDYRDRPIGPPPN